MRNKNFAIMICTHGRPDKQYTLEALRKAGYTGNVILIVDDEDDTVDKLCSNYEDYNTSVCIFPKQCYIDNVDYGPKLFRKVILYGKCACENLAKKLQLDTFVISDDDTKQFRYRFIEDGKLRALPITKNFDEVADTFVDYLINADLTALSFGFTSSYLKGTSVFDPVTTCNNRVAYNFVFRNSKHKVDWRGSYGEDLITACTSSIVGNVWMNMPVIHNDMVVQGKSDGGMTELYKSQDSLELVQCETMYCPTSMKAQYYKTRWYGAVQRENTFPKIISSRYSNL